ncbi:hypothetical protein [Gimesia panareensis]|uniref:hypothetical protein n=1 Tax=Gimesia panareensis TaxID=2527978 RepID=UPI001187AAC7|nr:hypothetical protein [Gimesia panareensis]QDU51256.1 hypothetical protein Pan110_36200 [Gimesia panareensis]
MARRPFLHFLLSANALQVHLLCLTLIVLLSLSIWEGNAQPDYKWGLLFAIVVYPVLLILLWYSDRLEEREAVEHVIESLTEPERLRRKRRAWRRGSLIVFGIVALGMIYAGHQGWQIDLLPAHYLGYFFLLVTILGTLGVNIWYGGPLDSRMDPPHVETENIEEVPEE